MGILDTENLEYFYEVDSNRQEKVLKKISNYNFKENLDLIRELLERPGLDDGIFRPFIDENDNLFLRVSLMHNFEIVCYYINAFEVYKAMYTTAIYFKDKELTKKWRKIMKSTYTQSDKYFNTSEYVNDLQKFLKSELTKKQNKLIEEFNQENIDLL